MLLPILVFTHGCAYSVPYAAVLYAEFAYIVTYDFLELNIVVLLCLIRQLGLKAFSVLLVTHNCERNLMIQSSRSKNVFYAKESSIYWMGPW